MAIEKLHVVRFSNVEKLTWLKRSPMRQNEHNANTIIAKFDDVNPSEIDHIEINGIRADNTQLPSEVTNIMTSYVLPGNILDDEGNIILASGSQTWKFTFSNQYTNISGFLTLTIIIYGENDEVLATAKFQIKVEPLPTGETTIGTIENDITYTTATVSEYVVNALLKDYVIKFNKYLKGNVLLDTPIRQNEHNANRLIVYFNEITLPTNSNVLIKAINQKNQNLPEGQFLDKVTLANDYVVNGLVVIPSGTVTWQYVYSSVYTFVPGKLTQNLYIVDNTNRSIATETFIRNIEPLPNGDSEVVVSNVKYIIDVENLNDNTIKFSYSDGTFETVIGGDPELQGEVDLLKLVVNNLKSPIDYVGTFTLIMGNDLLPTAVQNLINNQIPSVVKREGMALLILNSNVNASYVYNNNITTINTGGLWAWVYDGTVWIPSIPYYPQSILENMTIDAGSY
jgi:hypothetical protein